MGYALLKIGMHTFFTLSAWDANGYRKQHLGFTLFAGLGSLCPRGLYLRSRFHKCGEFCTDAPLGQCSPQINMQHLGPLRSPLC